MLILHSWLLSCVVLVVFFFFFFSSRRRHTRSLRDWSSDVCSSDLPLTDTAQVRWADANGNPYGPVSASFTTTVQSSRSTTLTLAPESAGPDVVGRSEERRVGKECRCRWAAEQ